MAALRDEARLNAVGERAMRRQVVSHLSQRLQVEDWYRRHPEIADEALEPALIGLGLPRTGSTALSVLLGHDPEVRSLRWFESNQPCPPSTVRGPDPASPDGAIACVAGQVHAAHQHLVPVTATAPGSAWT